MAGLPANGASIQRWALGRLRRDDRNRTLMRHTRGRLTQSVGALATAMRRLARRRCLVAAAGPSHLSLAHPIPTGITAVALAAVAAPTHRKDGAAVRVLASARAQAVNGSWLCPIHSNHYKSEADDRTDARAVRRDDVACPAKVQKRTISDDRLHSGNAHPPASLGDHNGPLAVPA
jgi:hypothetical protein